MVAAKAANVVVPPAKPHLATLDALRGIAALAVCWFHFTNAQFTERFPTYRSTGHYGYLGVQVFFVISGFVIPWSLLRADYRIGSFFRFLARRILRLDPPYLCSIAFVLAGYFISSMTPGHSHLYRIPWGQVLAHLGYVNVFLHMPWFQMSYWSLAVEFQYYLFVGLAFVLLARRGALWSALIAALFISVSLPFGHDSSFLPHHLPVFLLGITAFRFKCLNTSRLDLVCGIAVASALAWYVDGLPAAIAGLASCAAILFVNFSTQILDFFGRISYSLYLMHVFVGNVVYGFAARRPGDLGLLKWTLPWVALALAILVAYAMYRIVELPSKNWSAKIRYGSRPFRRPAGQAIPA
jgi:peptidoglycan/LPS O-acetylase OafA/YrhL